MQDNENRDHPRFLRNDSINELCCTVFYMARYAEALEIDKAITVGDEQELFWMILEWAQRFEQSFDPSGPLDYQTELECHGPRWLRETFPYEPELEEGLAADSGQGMALSGM